MRGLVSLTRAVSAACVIAAIAAPALAAPIVNFGTVDTFAGASGLDLVGYSFPWAWDVAGPTLAVGGVTFVDDAALVASGATINSQNVNYPWGSRPQYGAGADNDNLEEIMWGIRWSWAPGGVAADLPVIAGRTYKLQLLFSENFWSSPGQRSFDIVIEGATGVDEFDTLFFTGGWAGQPTVGARYTYSFTAPDGLLNISLAAGGDPAIPDHNPILNALTIEDIGIPEPTSLALLGIALTAAAIRGRRRRARS
ncbi:MAG: PEP-CTERM sorting domain-containing protein [Planctomycetes bacterium]|nr:PEP-CTERM sorting domain-containing protein [Planctomycetota bacterium]